MGTWIGMCATNGPECSIFLTFFLYIFRQAPQSLAVWLESPISTHRRLHFHPVPSTSGPAAEVWVFTPCTLLFLQHFPLFQGTLVGDFLRQQPDTTAEDIDTYARSIQAERSEYGAFTVLLWQLQHGQAPRCVAVTNVEDQNPPFGLFLQCGWITQSSGAKLPRSSLPNSS